MNDNKIKADCESKTIMTSSVSSRQGDSKSSELGGNGNGIGSEPNEGNKDNGGDSETGEETDQDQGKSSKVRKMRRVMANRRSARESRDRRMKLLEELEQSVDALTANNSELAKNNLTLRQELGSIMKECGLSRLVSSSLVSNLSLEALLLGQGLFSTSRVGVSHPARAEGPQLESFLDSLRR
jgi:hypothetical protein